jgi:hypothetical protein
LWWSILYCTLKFTVDKKLFHLFSLTFIRSEFFDLFGLCFFDVDKLCFDDFILR